MIILGIDPGYGITGYGLIYSDMNKYKPIEYGSITTPSDCSMSYRLKIIYDRLNEIIKEYRPNYMAVEKLFYNSNAKTVIEVGEARGIVLLAAEINGVELSEYTPLQVKQAVVGYGRAEKKQIQYMVTKILNLDEIPKPDDTADALAVAICHSQFYTMQTLYKTKEVKK